MMDIGNMQMIMGYRVVSAWLRMRFEHRTLVCVKMVLIMQM